MRPSKEIVYTEEIIRDKIENLLAKEFVSTTAIQCFFDAGYPLAGRIIEEMFRLGLIISENPDMVIGGKYNLEKRQELEEYLYNKFKELRIPTIKDNETIKRATLLKEFSEKDFSQDFLMEISKMVKDYRIKLGDREAENFAEKITNMMKLYSEQEILEILKSEKQ